MIAQILITLVLLAVAFLFLKSLWDRWFGKKSRKPSNTLSEKKAELNKLRDVKEDITETVEVVEEAVGLKKEIAEKEDVLKTLEGGGPEEGNK